MIHFGRFVSIIFFCVTVVSLSGCGSKQTPEPDGLADPQYKVTCIGVLPAVTMSDPLVVNDKEKDKSLRRGAEVMDTLLSRELKVYANIRFVTSGHTSALKINGGEGMLEMARLVGQDINCNAILESQVWLFVDRVGGKYTAESPASVAFDMRLIGVDTGTVLWSAKFNEVQRSVMENMYDWSKARSRGFTWVTAEDLMEEGVFEKLEDSPYFVEQ